MVAKNSKNAASEAVNEEHLRALLAQNEQAQKDAQAAEQARLAGLDTAAATHTQTADADEDPDPEDAPKSAQGAEDPETNAEGTDASSDAGDDRDAADEALKKRLSEVAASAAARARKASGGKLTALEKQNAELKAQLAELQGKSEVKNLASSLGLDEELLAETGLHGAALKKYAVKLSEKLEDTHTSVAGFVRNSVDKHAGAKPDDGWSIFKAQIKALREGK